MKVLAAGGGSGGHVTPVVAVLRELKARNDNTEIRFWCDVKFIPQAREIMNHFDASIPVESIISGKLRRYKNLSLLRQLTYAPIVLRNIRDGFFVVIGFFQSLVKLTVWRPDVIFAKGGYVCLPIGLAARVLGIPLVIHDSDARPGLTNRVLARFAKAIATGAPLEHYPYPKNKSRYIGIPISDKFYNFTQDEQIAAKVEVGISTSHPLVVITGGGLGATRINDAIVVGLESLLSMASVILISGTAQYDELKAKLPENSKDFQLHSFVSDKMAAMLGAADVVVTRAGATTILELAALGKPTILIPNRSLTDQLKNATVYKETGAVVVIDETDLENNPDLLLNEIKTLLSDEEKRRSMVAAFGVFARPNAAKDMVDMIIISASKY